MNTARGFTLIELMATLSIAAIVLTVGVPSFRDLISDNRLTADVNDFISAIQLTRSEAIKRQRNTEICISTTFAANPPTCTGGQSWAAGWVVWADNNRNNAIEAGEVLQVHEPFKGNVTFTAAAKSLFRYNSIGLVDTAGTLTLCDSRTGEQGRQVAISNAGRTGIINIACP